MQLNRLLTAALPLLLIAAAPAAQAGRVETLADPALAAVVEGRPLPVRVVEIMLATARKGSKEATFNRTVDGLIENQLLARDAERVLGRDRLMQQDRVGFAPAVTLEQQFHTLVKQTYRQQMDDFVRAQPGGDLSGLLTWQIPGKDPALTPLMRLDSKGEVRMTPAQLALADKTVVARITLPDGSRRAISFRELYDRTNVQGRLQLLQEGDRQFLRAQVITRTEGLFIDWWAAKHSGLTADEIGLLRKLLEEKHFRDTYLFELGVISVIHEDTPKMLTELEERVTTEDIRSWYAKNREMFRQVEKVRARHIRCATEAACDEASKAIAGGMDFAAAVRKYSVADDRNAAIPGDLGWLVRADPKLPWIGQIALIQQAGQVTRPIRTPEDAQGNAAWEIVRVDERLEGYSPADSETVAYLGRKEIAKRRAVERYNALRERLQAEADIRVNGKLLQARHTALDDVPYVEQPAEDTHDHGHKH